MISSGSESVDEGSSSDAAAADSHGTEVDPAAPSDLGKPETPEASVSDVKGYSEPSEQMVAAEGSRPMVPKRVTRALEKSKTFADFKENRRFTFIHLFSGRQDVLCEAIVKQAEQEGLEVRVVSLDKLTDSEFDLSKDQPYGDVLDDARAGEFDGGHAGPPCGSFSMARYNEGFGRKPVRSLEEIYGLESNNPRQQAEADTGTILFVRSLQVVGEIVQAQRWRKVPECGTVENPPGSDNQREGPAWRLPETEAWVEKFQAETAVFNTCAYQMKLSKRWWKKGKFVGRLEGLATLSRKCSCIKGFRQANN